MTKPNPQDLLDKELPKMPKEIQALFDSEELANKLDSISKKNKLSEDQTDALFDTVAYTLFGIISIDSVKKELEAELHIDTKTSLSITTELYGSVFSPVKKFIKETGGSANTADLKHEDIIKEIENPTPSIKPVPAVQTKVVETKPVQTQTTGAKIPTLQEALGSEVELGGFVPVVPAVNPAIAVAAKLDQKLSAPTTHIPKEIYQVKKADPYHEPIE